MLRIPAGLSASTEPVLRRGVDWSDAPARVAESVDAGDSKSPILRDIRVRVSSRVSSQRERIEAAEENPSAASIRSAAGAHARSTIFSQLSTLSLKIS